MQSQKVFLAIDNVAEINMDEAKRNLQAGYSRGSIVLVSSRSLKVLKYLSINETDCLAMPELNRNEATQLFLYHAHPKKVVDEEVLLHCINQSYLKRYDGGYHYHPLALKVLGSQLAGRDPKEWKLQLKEDVLNPHPIFSILRRSFDELEDEDQLLFMDVALFDIDGDYKKWRDYPIWNFFEWLSMVHGTSVATVKRRVMLLI